MLTALAVIIRILSNPLANVFQKQLTARSIPASAVNFLTYFLLSLVSFLFSFAIPWGMFPPEFWIYSAVVGLLGAAGNGLLIRALQYGELSIMGPINAYKSIVGLIVALFLIGEVPGIRGCLGIALIVWGSYFVLDTATERFSWRLLKRKDIRYRVGAMVLAATEAVFIKKVILLSSPGISFMTWCWFGAFFSLAGLLAVPGIPLRNRFQSAKLRIALLLKLGVCIGMMQLTTNYVFGAMFVGYALSLFQLSAIVSVVFGSHFFNEKEILRKSVGAGIMIAGSVVIILFTK